MKYLETNDSLRSKILIILHSRFDPTQGSTDCPGLETDQSELLRGFQILIGPGPVRS